MKPLHSFFVIKVEKEDNVTASGIITSSKEKPSQKAVILEVPNDPREIKNGDTVIVNMYAPLDISVNGETITIVDYADIYLLME